MLPTLQQLIDDVVNSTDGALGSVESAVTTAEDLSALGDRLISHFVDEARRAGCSWSELAKPLSRSRRSASLPTPATEVAELRTSTAPGGALEHSGKYRPLWEWLTRQSSDQITMTFAEIEAILGFALPASSRNHLPHWYGYKGSAVARAIIDAGWRARDVDLTAETVRLERRTQPGHTSAAPHHGIGT